MRKNFDSKTAGKSAGKSSQNPIILLQRNSQASEKIKKPIKKKIFYYKIINQVYKDKIKELDVLCIEWNLLTT